MFDDTLMPVLTLSGVAVAAGYMLTALGNANNDKFDERQLVERGRGANLAMSTALVYLLGLYMGHSFELFRTEHGAIFAVYGLIVMMMVFDAHCIFHDAFQQRGEKLGTRILSDGLFGVLWLATALRRGAWDMEGACINGALALFWLSRIGMLLLRAYILHIRDCREEREEADG